MARYPAALTAARDAEIERRNSALEPGEAPWTPGSRAIVAKYQSEYRRGVAHLATNWEAACETMARLAVEGNPVAFAEMRKTLGWTPATNVHLDRTEQTTVTFRTEIIPDRPLPMVVSGGQIREVGEREAVPALVAGEAGAAEVASPALPVKRAVRPLPPPCPC